MAMERIVLGTAALLLAITGGCSGGDGAPSNDDLDAGVDGFDENYISEVCQRMDGCDMADDSTLSECIATGTEILDAQSPADQEVFQRSLGDCLDLHRECDAFSACVGDAVQDASFDLDGGVEPPDACGVTGALCTLRSDCCAGYLCVNFGDSVTCARTCTADSQCLGDSCCVSLEGGGGACGPASFCDPPTSDPCGDCISSCSGLGIPGCCTGVGCICEDECAVSGCTPPARFCCGPYDCICTTNCPYD